MNQREQKKVRRAVKGDQKPLPVCGGWVWDGWSCVKKKIG